MGWYLDIARRVILERGLVPKPPVDLPLVGGVNTAFANVGGAEIVQVCSARTWHRRQVADLIRQARRAGDRSRAVALRDAFRERVAICAEEGGLPIEDAERIACEELQNDYAKGC